MTKHHIIWRIQCGLCVIWMVLIVANATEAGQPEYINFVHFYNLSGVRATNNLVEVINNAVHPEFVIKANAFEHESFKVAIKAMLSTGGVAPDLFTYWAGARVQALVDAGYLAPLDDIWVQTNLDERVGPAISRASTYSGHKYIMPLNRFYVTMFYNAAIFKEHGLTPPTTWEAFLSICETLKNAGVTPIALGVHEHERWPAQFWFDYLLLRTAGPEFRQSLMTGQAAYTDPEVQNAFRLWKELIDRDYFNQTPNVYTWYEVGRMLFHGQAAMTLMGSWAMTFFEGELGWQQQDYGFFPFPVIDPAIPVASLGPIDCVVLPHTRKVQAAKKVLPYFIDVAPQHEMLKGIGSLSPNQEMPMSLYTEYQQEMLRAINDAPYWAFNYDLSTPEPVAEIGLQAFVKFVERPDRYLEILEEVESQVSAYFSTH